ncbi:NEL-type E3 ubiquitin ligase domain-containing protein [Pseudomonas frederiksbergensis]|uniref:NEL-type E3 ubiquitin ligase domain-containing protein n=1 Tax=Pseudomonas frederiksbergensis TaxID=104087 RepID=UPI000F48C435|nr:DUF6543 domain-containing protein [Pseudomonas frederiksbergensis]RON54115.1 hypothetical protein BK667_11500 [Pseudomonas frederiksbergensis]
MTPEQQGVFYALFKDHPIPSWLSEADGPARTSLYARVVASQKSRVEAAMAMAALKSPQQFCSPLLAKAIEDKLGEPLDIRGVVFQHVRSTSSLLGLRKKLVLPIDRDLLVAACENFEASETLESNYDDKSLIYQPERINGTSNKILALKPHEFAQLCRTLDLGKQYQTHLNSVFEPHADTGAVRQACVHHSQRVFDVDRYQALMKKNITEPLFQMLDEVMANTASIKLGQRTVAYKRLELLGYKLCGAMLIVTVSDGAYVDNPCVLYLPGDTEQPLKEYASVTALEVDLGSRLLDKTFESLLMRFVSLRDRPGFHSALAARDMRPASHWMQPSQRASLPVTTLAVTSNLFADLYLQRAEQVMADARLLVVPTDDEDEKSRLARMDTYTTIGLDLVLFGVSFIPMVGEVMMALTVADLLLGVYHGIESWAAGEQEQAADYYFDTLENLIVMGALSAGAGAARVAFRRVRTSPFVESLREIRFSEDRVRLWKPDLAPYRRNISLPRWLKPDERGLRWFEDQAYVALDKDVYAVRPQADTDLWEIEGSNLGENYAPALETNNVGAWRHDSELPLEWDRLTLFRRLGYLEQDIPDARALQILLVSATDDDALRRVLIDRTRPPALLVDTVRRFATDSWVTGFIQDMSTERTAAVADADLQLRLLTSLKTWPVQTAINVVDATGQPFSRYTAPGVEQPGKTLRLNLDKVRKGEFYPELLSGLSASERTHLLDSPSVVAAEQITALVQKLAEQADRKRRDLFEWIYQRAAPEQVLRATPLSYQFSDLPISVIDELIRHADSSELTELEAGNVPLRLAEEARRYRQVVRVSRAYEGLYLDAVGGIDTDRVVFGALRHLPGWQSDLYVHVLEWSFYTDEMASIGAENASQQLLINAHPDRFEVRDASSNLLSYLPGRTRAHYFQALWEGLSVSRRSALGLHVEDHGVGLRAKITNLALERRAFAQASLGIFPVRAGYVSPMRLADPLLVKPSAGAAPQVPGLMGRSSAVIRRAQELYPTHSMEQIELFLSSLGPDEVLVLRKLENLRLEYLTIRTVLQNWVNRDTWYQTETGPRLKVSTLAKNRAAMDIIRCWRRETPSTLTLDGRLYELSFAPLQLGNLPLITGDFSHVGALVMDRVGASPGLNTFLRNFKFLRRLSLVGNQLTRVPQAVSTMPRLETLDLSDNHILMTPAAVADLAGLFRLKTLNLNTNPTLTQAPDVARMQLLERLELRSTGISHWPSGSTGLRRLRVLDLRDNSITEIPEDVFAAPGSLNLGTNISGNPLSAQARQRLTAFQQTSEISLGLIATGRGQDVRDVLMDLTMSSTWLTGASALDTVRRRQLWSAVYAYPDSRPFFTLLNRLRFTADFRVVYRSLSQRVWDVIEAAAEDSHLRRTLFRMANVGQLSADGSSLVFSDLHVQVLCYRALGVVRDRAATETELVRLLRGLYRLQEVERLAVKNVISRSRTGPLTLEQAMEISLAYRVGLAERLDLPAQPRDMNLSLAIDVIPQTLDWVYGEVLKLEQSSALAHWMTLQEFWKRYVEGIHQANFDDLVLRTAVAFQQLDRESRFGREQYNQHMDAIVNNFRNERIALMAKLTADSLRRNPGLPSIIDDTKRTPTRFTISPTGQRTEPELTRRSQDAH